MLRRWTLLLLAILAPLAGADCETNEAGSRVEAGDSDLSTTFEAASTSDDAAFAVVLHDPDDSVGGDEEYYLRFLASQDDDTVQEGDLKLTTGRLLEEGDEEIDLPSSEIDDAFSASVTFLAYDTGPDLFWYYDADGSGGVTRFDVRVTDVEIQGESYSAGTRVRISDEDHDEFEGATPAETEAGRTNAAFGWHDADDDEKISPGDCLLFQPGGFGASAEVGDIRLTGTPGTAPAPTVTLESNVTSGDMPLAVAFTIDGTSEDSTFTWSFDVDGDGTVEESGEALPALFNHTYADAGTYLASVSIEDGDRSSQANVTITVIDPEASAPLQPPPPPSPPSENPPPPPSPGEEGDKEDEGAPGPGLLSLLFLLGAVAVGRRP